MFDCEIDNTALIMTLEVLSESSTDTSIKREYTEDQSDNTKAITEPDAGVRGVPEASGIHLVAEKENDDSDAKTDETGEQDPDAKSKSEFMEYLTRSDGSVVCKLCGEILQSRTHWYRHKYKLHVIPPLNPAPLFQCEQCLVFFKSRKGYIGHLASRHSELLSDTNPVLTNTQAEAHAKEATQPRVKDEKQSPDPEHVTVQETVPNLNASAVTTRRASVEVKRPFRSSRAAESPRSRAEWDERRSREERMVASIIDRVRRECEAAEAQGSGGPARRGYTRRTTVMHT